MKQNLVLLMAGLLFSAFCVAEHQAVEPQIYSNKSRLTIENLNRTTEIIRDPTRVSGSFREALNKIKPGSQQQTKNNKVLLPKLNLNALVEGPNQTYSAMLKVDDKVVLVKTGDKMSFVTKQQLYEIVINDINSTDVHLTILPANEKIILR